MRYLSLVILVSMASTVSLAWAGGLRLSEPVQSDAHSETFGQPMAAGESALSLAQLLGQAEPPLNQAVMVHATVAKVCQKKGCFFVAYDGEHSLRVSFKDYGFFVPTDIAGRRVTLAGELVAQELSDTQAAHFNKDLANSSASSPATVKPGRKLEMVATAVRVPRH